MSEDIHRSVDKVVDNVVRNYVEISSGSEIVVLFDRDKAVIAEALGKAIAARGATPILRDLSIGVHPLLKVITPLLSDAGIGLLVLASHEMWRSGLDACLDPGSEPISLKGVCQPLFFDAVIPAASFLRLYGSDPASDRSYLRACASSLPEDTPMRVTAPGGTDLQMVTRRWRTMTWETLTSPVEDSIDGRIVADASIFCGAVTSPVSVELEHGRIMSIRCEDQSDNMFQAYARWMQQAHQDSLDNWQLAEIGVGGNAQAILSGVIMEDEAVRGTCHFCFGDNTRYGGTNYSEWHGGTLVVRSPRFERL